MISSGPARRHARRDTGEIRALTSLRGLAALYVVAYHAADAAGADLVPRGYLAVDLFFVLSGFVLALTAAGEFGERGLRAVPGFWARRLARILPLNLAVVACVTLANLAAHGGAGVPAARVACNAAALQGFGWCVTLNAPAWTLSFEWLGYLVFPAMVGIVARRRPAGTIALGALASAGIALLAWHTGSGSVDSSQFAPGWSAIRCLAEMSLGLLAWQGFLAFKALPFWRGDTGAAALLAILATACLMHPEDAWFVALCPASVLVLAANRGRAGRILGHKLLHRLGEISFSIYLLHDAILQREARLASALMPGWRMAAPVFVVLATLSIIAPAWLTWRWIEQPGRAAVRRLLTAPGRPGERPVSPV